MNYSLIDTENPEVRKTVSGGLRRFNRQFAPTAFREDKDMPPDLKFRDFILCSDAGEIVAGLLSEVYWESMSIMILWVDESLRGQGVGTELVRRAEEEARRLDCRFIWLTTMEFQAPRFYEKFGFRVVCEMTDFPPGHTHFTMRKELKD